MVETLQSTPEFEQNPNREREKKYLPLFPESLERFRPQAVPIEQIYLSHPDELFTLRLRETIQDGELVYSATLKDVGQMTEHGLDRLEIETGISPETYAYYRQENIPTIRKMRAEPYRNIVIDWFEDGHVQVESEHPISWISFLEQHRLMEQTFVDTTGDRQSDNEWRAHLTYRKLHNGEEAFQILPDIDAPHIAKDLLTRNSNYYQTIATIVGRSGSGKSTLIREVQSILHQNGGQSIVLSTDDYHRGKTWLENYKGGPWTEWDAPIVYDLEALQKDIETLQQGKTITRRQFDFQTEEPIVTGLIDPAPFILIEGIYAGDISFDKLADLRYELPTPLATCIGRRLLRDLSERPQFADPEKSLRYILEQAEPAYRNQT